MHYSKEYENGQKEFEFESCVDLGYWAIPIAGHVFSGYKNLKGFCVHIFCFTFVFQWWNFK